MDEARVAALAAAPPVEHVEVRGGPLALLRWHPPAEVPRQRPVLLVHGHTGSKEDFAALGGLLAGAGHPVVAPDGRGQQDSPGTGDAASYGLDAFAADVLGLVDVLDLAPVHLVGHSFGGLVAREAVLTRPEAVASLTLLGSGPAALPDGPRRQALLGLVHAVGAGGLPVVLAGVAALADADPALTAAPQEWRDFLRRRWEAWDPVALATASQALLDAGDRTDELRDVARSRRLPLLVLHGEDDDAWPPALQEATARRLGARHVVVPDAAHGPAAERPAATAAALLEHVDAAESAAGPW